MLYIGMGVISELTHLFIQENAIQTFTMPILTIHFALFAIHYSG